MCLHGTLPQNEYILGSSAGCLDFGPEQGVAVVSSSAFARSRPKMGEEPCSKSPHALPRLALLLVSACALWCVCRAV